jgi:hypothetical protein
MTIESHLTTRFDETGFPMAKGVKIENFRCFKSAEVSDCRRVNVVVGENGSGKTAFLEALFLTAGSGAELGLRTRAWRGFENVHGQANLVDLEQALWGDLFYDFKYGAQIAIRLSGVPAHSRSVKIKFNPVGPAIVQVSKDRSSATVDVPGPTRGVDFEWQGPGQLRYRSTANFEDGKLKITGDVESPIAFAFFASMAMYSAAETATRYSMLSKMGEEATIAEAFIRQYPEIEALSLEIAGNAPMIFAKRFGERRRVPLNLISGGMTKLCAILFAMPSLKNGIMVIDELENGFHFSRLPNIWGVLNKLSAEFNVQLFIATHSLECLRAAAGEAKLHPDDFSLIRAERRDGNFLLKQFSGEQFVGSVAADLEIR